MIVDKINEYLSSERIDVPGGILSHVGNSAVNSFSRQFGEDGERRSGTIRLSSIGRCLRQQAYKALDIPENGKEIDSRAKMVFFQGDMTELAIVHLAKLAGCKVTAIGTEQMTISLDGIMGHPDGVLFHEGQVYLLEVKSMSSFGFSDFERGNLDEGYRYQINAYMVALGLQKAAVVALNKDSGVLGEMLVVRDEDIVADIKHRIEVLKNLDGLSLPDRPYSPDAKGFYPWNCLYCGFWKTCLPNAEKVLVSSRYKLKEIMPKKELVQ